MQLLASWKIIKLGEPEKSIYFIEFQHTNYEKYSRIHRL